MDGILSHLQIAEYTKLNEEHVVFDEEDDNANDRETDCYGDGWDHEMSCFEDMDVNREEDEECDNLKEMDDEIFPVSRFVELVTFEEGVVCFSKLGDSEFTHG